MASRSSNARTAAAIAVISLIFKLKLDFGKLCRAGGCRGSGLVLACCKVSGRGFERGMGVGVHGRGCGRTLCFLLLLSSRSACLQACQGSGSERAVAEPAMTKGAFDLTALWAREAAKPCTFS